MIKSITITNHLNETLHLELTKPEKSGFIIKEIKGLGPVKAEINFTEMATFDGALDNSARIGTRNIVISLIFLENPTIEDARLLSYKYFPNKQKIIFGIETDRRKCEIVGRVEENEPNIFSKQEGCEISILCSDPYFYAKDNNITTFSGVDPLFEFPFSNEFEITYDTILDSNNKPLIDSNGDEITVFDRKKYEETKTIEFGEIRNVVERNIHYDGDVETGIILTIHAIGLANGITIYNGRTRELMKIDDKKLAAIMGSGIQAGDDIIINTNKGEKSITMLRSGEYTNIINVLGRPITWFQLSQGDNLFICTAEEGSHNLQFTIENKVLYEGV